MLPTVSATPSLEKEMQNLTLMGPVIEVQFELQARSDNLRNDPKWLYSKNQYENPDFSQSFQVEITTSPIFDHEKFRSRLRVAARRTLGASVDFTEPLSVAKEESSSMFAECPGDIQSEEKKIYIQLMHLSDDISPPNHEICFLFDLSAIWEEDDVKSNLDATPREEFPIIPDEGSEQPVQRVGIVFQQLCKQIDVTVKTIREQPPHSSIGARLEWTNGSDPSKKDNVDPDPTYNVLGKRPLRHSTPDGKNDTHSLYIKTSGKPNFTFGGSFYVDPTD